MLLLVRTGKSTVVGSVLGWLLRPSVPVLDAIWAAGKSQALLVPPQQSKYSETLAIQTERESRFVV